MFPVKNRERKYSQITLWYRAQVLGFLYGVIKQELLVP